MKEGCYFDYCATTPVDEYVRQAMEPFFQDHYGNPSSMHHFGNRARQALDLARTRTAEGLNCLPENLVFTSGATEANNLALLGVMRALPPQKNHLITTAIEHHAVLHAAEALKKWGYQVSFLPVNQYGLVDPEDLAAAIRPSTALISVMMVNNEIGTIQDIQALGSLAREADVLFHTDAVQAAPCVPLDLENLPVDLLSLSAHKMYGPKGSGVLYHTDHVPLSPLLFGGAQEDKLRPGTENIPGIVGMGAAMALRTEQLASRAAHCRRLRRILREEIKSRFPEAVIHGSEARAAPHILSVGFPGVDGEMLLFHLNRRGIAVSMGSACTSESMEPSHVLTALGVPEPLIQSTIRISLGGPTREEDLDRLLAVLPEALKLARHQP